MDKDLEAVKRELHELLAEQYGYPKDMDQRELLALVSSASMASAVNMLLIAEMRKAR